MFFYSGICYTIRTLQVYKYTDIYKCWKNVRRWLKKQPQEAVRIKEEEFMTSSDVESMVEGLIASGMIVFILAIIGIACLFVIALYVLQAVALYKMAKKLGHQYPWMAWIPYANTYLMFVLPDKKLKILAFNKEIDRKTAFWIFLGISLGGGVIETICSAFAVIPILGTIIVSLVPVALWVALIFLEYPMYKDLYGMFVEDSQSTAYAIISLIVPITVFVFMLIAASKNPKPVMQVEENDGKYYYY